MERECVQVERSWENGKLIASRVGEAGIPVFLLIIEILPFVTLIALYYGLQLDGIDPTKNLRSNPYLVK